MSLLVVSRNNAQRASALAPAQHKARRGEPPGLLTQFPWIRFSGRFSLHESTIFLPKPRVARERPFRPGQVARSRRRNASQPNAMAARHVPTIPASLPEALGAIGRGI